MFFLLSSNIGLIIGIVAACILIPCAVAVGIILYSKNKKTAAENDTVKNRQKHTSDMLAASGKLRDLVKEAHGTEEAEPEAEKTDKPSTKKEAPKSKK